MRIAIVGCGAVGSFYGAKLARAGQEVHFLLRTDYEAVRRKGVRIQSREGDFVVHPKCARAPEEIGPVELVVIGLKTTANDQFSKLLGPLAGPGTAVLTLQNGLGNEEQISRVVSKEQILGGLCFVCLNRVAPGVVHHLDHGLIVVGEFERWPEPRTHDIATMFRAAGVPCRVTDDLARTHWEKLVWNIPFNGLGVAGAAGLEVLSGGTPIEGGGGGDGVNARPPDEARSGPATIDTLTTDKLLGEPRWFTLVRELMLEVIGAARALGFDVAESLADKQIERTRTMGAYKASTLIDFERGQPIELESLFLEPLRQAQAAGAPVPRLQRLCDVLSRVQRS